MHEVSIVIPSHNSAQQLESLLHTIFSKITQSRLELIIVDQGKTDNTSQIIAQHATKGFIRYFKADKNKNSSFTYLCNLASTKAQYEYLLFLAADVVYLEDFFDQIFKKMPNANMGISSKTENNLKSAEPVKLFQKPLRQLLSENSLKKISHRAGESVFGTEGICLFCRKNDFEKLGGFVDQVSINAKFDVSGLNRKLGQNQILETPPKKNWMPGFRRSTKESFQLDKSSEFKKAEKAVDKKTILCVFSDSINDSVIKLIKSLLNNTKGNIAYQSILFINDGSPETISDALKNADRIIDNIYIRPFEVSFFFWLNQMLMRHSCDYFICINHQSSPVDRTIFKWAHNLLIDRNPPVIDIQVSQSDDDQKFIFGIAVDMLLVRGDIGFFSPLSAPYSLINYRTRIQWYLKRNSGVEWKHRYICDESEKSNCLDSVLVDIVKKTTKSMLQADSEKDYDKALGNLGPFEYLPQYILPKNYELLEGQVQTNNSNLPRWYYTFDSYFKRAGLQPTPLKSDLVFLPHGKDENLVVLSSIKNNQQNVQSAVTYRDGDLFFVDLHPLTLNEKFDLSYLQSNSKVPILPALPSITKLSIDYKYLKDIFSSNKKVSILSTAHNVQDSLFDAYYSILQQSYDNIELVLVDSGSEDKTLEYASALLELFPYVRKKIVSLPEDISKYPALNVALLESCGDYVTRHGLEDFSTPQRIFLSVITRENYKAVSVCFNESHLDLKGNLIVLPGQKNNSFCISTQAVDTLLYPRSLIGNIGLFFPKEIDPSLEYIDKIKQFYSKSAHKAMNLTCYYKVFKNRQNQNNLMLNALNLHKINHSINDKKKQTNHQNLYPSCDPGHDIISKEKKIYFSFDYTNSFKTICNIVTIPSRQEQFLKAFESICHQVDHINVILNNFDEVPKKFQDIFNKNQSKCNIIRSQDIGDIRDNAKFYCLNERSENSYYFTVDDDIVYPYDYVNKLLYKSKIYNDKVAICVHGYCLWKNIFSLHSDVERRCRHVHFSDHLDFDVWVDIAGTGTLLIPPKINLQPINKELTGVSDVVISKKLRELNVPIISIARPKGWLKKIPVNDALFVENQDSSREKIIRSYLPPINERVCFQPNKAKYNEDNRLYDGALQLYYAPIADIMLNSICDKPVFLCCTGFNYEKYACIFIKSLWHALRATNYCNINVLIFDDCSEDDSLNEILKCVKKYLLQWHVKIFKSKKNMGPAFGRAFLLELIESSNAICIFLDLDDEVKPGFLRRIISEYAFNTDAVGTFGSWCFNDIVKRPWPSFAQNELKLKEEISGQFKISPPRTFLKQLFVTAKKDLFFEPNGEWLKYCSDLALMLSIIPDEGLHNFKRINEILYMYNFGVENNTLKKFGNDKKLIRDYLYTSLAIMKQCPDEKEKFSKHYNRSIKQDFQNVIDVSNLLYIDLSSYSLRSINTNEQKVGEQIKSKLIPDSKFNYHKNHYHNKENIQLEKKAEFQIKMLRQKLLSLGFTFRAYNELLELSKVATNRCLKILAFRELAVWHANQYNQEDAVKSLDMLALAKDGESNPDKIRQNAVIEAECLELLGQKRRSRKVIEQALERELHADLFLAAANLESSIEDKMTWINKALSLHGISPIVCTAVAGQAPYDSLYPAPGTGKKAGLPSNAPKVTVIIPAYNAQDTISTALGSVLAQTWTNLEVLVVDDCSTDDTADVVNNYIKRDERVRLIRAEINQGPYVARNLALREATGEFVTVNDADDWSHPEKIAIQINHLIKKPEVIANTSELSRCYDGLRFFRRGQTGCFIQLNMSSLMFRREEIIQTIGYWDSVRFAADGEFKQRIKKCFGDKSVVDLKTGPLSFIRQSENSLTGNNFFGYTGYLMGARKEYFESFKHYHQKTDTPYFDFPSITRLFPVPEPMRPIREKTVPKRRHFDVVIASDFTLPGGTSSSNIEEIKVQKKLGLLTGLVHMPRYDLDPRRLINPKIRSLIDGEQVQMLVYGENISCDLLIIRHPPILQVWQKYIPNISSKDIRVIINQTPKTNYGAKGKSLYVIKNCLKNLHDLFGKSATWHPIGPLARFALQKYHSSELQEIILADNDWHNIIDISAWYRQQRPVRQEKIIIGRHSRPDNLKWPHVVEDILNVYPDSESYEVRVLGGADTPKKLLGYLPKNWRIYEFGSMHPRDFLAELDVFVYYTHPESFEAFGRVIFEAMAVGVPVILPHNFSIVFQNAAVYAHPEEVKFKIMQLMENNELYDQQVFSAHKFVEESFSHKTHENRLKEIITNLNL